MPTFIKDMIGVAGLPVRWGSDTLRNAGPAKKSGGIALQTEDMGLIFLGKTTTPEWGLAPSAEISGRSSDAESLEPRPLRGRYNTEHVTFP